MEPAMYLFKTEWLREPPRPFVDSCTRAAYGIRCVRRTETDYEAALKFAGLPVPAQAYIEPQPAPLDRAA
jgi:hypothetical protein